MGNGKVMSHTVYHGTSKKALISIELEGVTAPSYWGTLEEAKEYADSFGSDGVIISTNTQLYSFEANIQLAESLNDDADEEDEISIECHELEKSLNALGSVVCTETVFRFDKH